MSGNNEEDDRALSVGERLRNLDPVTMAALDEVLRLERSKLHLLRPHGIKQDIIDVVKRLVT
ncbi:hypothetical protein BJY14_004447 [Actinomadura luteofluorescens]|uniref:Uncharacterized protein n=1 Tax=Actinomadura luteofluorescens TaxID=46163 RepID=A0A7Y9EIV0_9ACTN|nr:hypothetical protein [Actinomadura luteofluorescens]